jgi:hypothetical protein
MGWRGQSAKRSTTYVEESSHVWVAKINNVTRRNTGKLVIREE